MPLPIVNTVVNKIEVNAIAITAIVFLALLDQKLFIADPPDRFFTIYPKHMDLLPPFLICYKFSILNTHDPVRHLGNLFVMRDHYNCLPEFIAGHF